MKIGCLCLALPCLQFGQSGQRGWFLKPQVLEVSEAMLDDFDEMSDKRDCLRDDGRYVRGLARA